jgi:hypothetical protein
MGPGRQPERMRALADWIETSLPRIAQTWRERDLMLLLKRRRCNALSDLKVIAATQSMTQARGAC